MAQSRLPPVTMALLIAISAGYLAQMLIGQQIEIWFALWPWGGAAESVGVPTGVWQWVSYAFLHGSFFHLLFNAFGIYMFGPPIERLLGARPFVLYWFVCVIGAALLHLVTLPSDALFPTIGASGGVFGLLLAFAMFYPNERVILLIPPIPMPAWVFATLYAGLELYLGVTGKQSGIAHLAHLGGMLSGIVLIAYWRGWLPIKPRRLLQR